MYSSLDQIESQIACAKRASIRSKRIIIRANDDLESHRQWVENHCAAWVEAVESFQRSLKSTEGVSAFMRGLIPAHGAKPHREAPPRTRRAQLSSRILVASVGAVTLFIAADAVRAMISVLPVVPKMPGAPQSMASVSSNVTTAPPKIQGPNRSLGRASGLRVIAAPSAQPLSMPPPTVATMMTITNPVALASEHDATSAPVEGATLAARPKARTKVKRKSQRQEPQPFPWLRQQP